MAAAKAANALSFIDTAPDGFETRVRPCGVLQLDCMHDC